MKKQEGVKRPFSLRGILLFTYMMAVVICFGVGMYNFLSAQMMLDEMASFVKTSQQLSEIQTKLHNFQSDIDDYLFSRNSLSLQSYYDHANDLQAITEKLMDEMSYTPAGIKNKNLSKLISRYLGDAEAIIAAKRNEKATEYVPAYVQIGDDFRLLNQYIQGTMASNQQENMVNYNTMQEGARVQTLTAYALFVVAFLFVVVLVITLSNNISRPIINLAKYARRVAGGEYDIEIGEETSNRELAQLYEAFDVMLVNTRLYLEGLVEKQSLESQLAQQEIKGLEKDYLLQQAELQALHAQMNPHFIFNTINIGAKIAMMQGNDVVCDYLENAAEVFRYNLAGLNNATLEEELGNVRAYLQLLSIRFGTKLQYSIKVAQGVPVSSVYLPRMTLQPLAENAFVHGVDPCEEGGSIDVTIKSAGEWLQIVIANTGAEFPREKIEALYTQEKEERIGHLSGIGLRNVIKRLQHQFRLERPIEIVPEQGKTVVTLAIPLTGGSEFGGVE